MVESSVEEWADAKRASRPVADSDGTVGIAAAAVVQKAAEEQIRLAVERLVVEVEGIPTCNDTKGNDNKGVVVASRFTRLRGHTQFRPASAEPEAVGAARVNRLKSDSIL